MESLVTVKQPVITLDNYAELEKQARQVADYINSVVLTEDNIKDVKKELAAARKVVTGLDTRRKEVKKSILEPFSDFESQVKALMSIVDEADSDLRARVKQMEEEARDIKKVEIREIWNKRILQYTFPDDIGDQFNSWLMPVHLNKTTSLKSIEKEMVTFMEETETDIEFIKNRPDAVDVLVEYASCLNLKNSIQIVEDREERRKAIEAVVHDQVDIEDVATFVVTGEKDIKLAEMILKENNIKYERTF